MFRIVTTDGVVLGLTDKVNYIKINERNGCFNSCDKKDAIGIAYQSDPYNLYGHDKITDRPTVYVVEVDSGVEITTTKHNTAQLEEQLAETDEAAIELYEANLALEEVNAEQDEAIIEIYELMGELTNG